MAAAPLFICHAFTENDFAGDLALALETCRLSVWRDTRQLRGGERLAPDVRWAIEQAQQVIVVIGLNTSDPAWLRREIEIAQETERRRNDSYRVIPLLLPGVDPALLHRWFTPLPPSAPIRLDAEGLGAALPDLLAALGARPLFDAERNRASAAELTVTLDASAKITLSADLPDGAGCVEARMTVRPRCIPERSLRWYWQDHPRWPIDPVRQFARQVETLLAESGHSLYQALFAEPTLQPMLSHWRTAPERRLILCADPNDPQALRLLALPWELLHDATGFLLQNKQPVELQRRLPGGGSAMPPTPVPLRLLLVNPRPDTEPTGHSDPRRQALPLFEAVNSLGALVEARTLRPPTQTALEETLNQAWAAGRPFFALHLDGCLLATATDPPAFAFEADTELFSMKYRETEFLGFPALATLLAAYRLRLAVLTGAGPIAVQLATTLLNAGVAAVLIVHPSAPVDALRRFWSAFYEELLRGARISQAVFAGQRRLASDSYRAQGLGGGGVHLHDWFTVQLYLGAQDPRLILRPPLDLWRRLLQPTGSASRGRLPEPSPIGFVGRGRSLLILERLLVQHSAVFIRGPGGCGKTATATALADWLMRCRHYPQIAYASDEDASEPHTLVESLGQQLLPNGRHWTVASYPNLWRAVDHLAQALHDQAVLIVLDQLEQWPAEQDEAFERFWKKLLNEAPKLRLLGLGRLGPPAFATPWREIVLGPLDEQDAITLMSRTLTAAGEIPPAADNRQQGFQTLRELVALAGGHPGALRRLAHEISAQGVSAALAHLRTIRAELLRRQSDDLQWPLYLGVELALNRLSVAERQRLAILALVKGGIHRLALGHALELDSLATDTLCEQLIALNLAEDGGYSHLRIDPALSSYLNSQLNAEQRSEWRKRWRAAMEHLLTFLYQQYFKDNARTLRLLRLELPNLLALLRDCQQHPVPERTARLASQLEPLLAHLGVSAALAETVAMRERAGQALPGWSRTRFETERLRIERLRDNQSLEEAMQAARQLLRCCQEAGADAYPGASYDQARVHFELGKLLKSASAAEPAVRELTAARQGFHALAETGNPSAARMAAVADAEIGDCLTYLRRLQDAATAYEAALARADPQSATGAADRLQLGLVYQRQGKYAAAAALYDAARRVFETLGEPEKVAQAWRRLSMAHKLGGQMEQALQAGQKSLYLYEQQRDRQGIAEILGEVAHLHQALNQLEEAVLAYRRMAEIYAQLGDGRREEASRNKLANVLIQLRRPDEARQELYRASECNPPESPTARNWAIRRGLHDVSQGVENLQVADLARQQAIHKYLAYRRSGGENTNPGSRLCAQINEALRQGHQETLKALLVKLEQIAASPNVPQAGKLLIDKLRAILNGVRDPALAQDPNLHYQYAAELQLLLEDLAANGK